MPTDKRIEQYFNLAHKASEFSDFKQHQLGAVLIHKNKILSVGWNSNRTSPIQKAYNRERGWNVDASCARNSLHAEMHCLLKTKDMDIDYSKASLYIYRQHKNGIKACAHPCPACMKMIKELGIKNIYYTNKGSWCYERLD